jgi:UDP-N-acetyl-D-glucosamine dehydrogenase
MPEAVVHKIADALNTRRKALNGSHVLVVGVAYKRDIDDIRESPSLDVMSLLEQKGVRVSYTDPFVPALAARAWHGSCDLTSVPLDAASLADVDCVAILTDHTSIDYTSLAIASPLVVDSRNAIKERHPHVFRLGAPATADAAGAAADEEAA